MSGKALLEAKFAEAVDTEQYIVPPGSSTLIDGIQVANNTGTNATIKINIIPAAGDVGASNVLQPVTTIAAGTRQTLLAGTWMNAGDKISTIAGTASALVIHIGGRVFP
jgi:hypothetical protein